MIEVSRDGKGVVWQCLWKQDCDFDLDNFSPNHIDGIINKGKEDEWRFTGFYCESNTSKHLVSWSCLRRLKAKHSILWLCVRDFNEIARSHEKLGGWLRPARQMQDFRDVLDECGFHDLGYEEGKFTWCNGHQDDFTVWE